MKIFRYGAPVMWLGKAGEVCFGVVHQITTTEGANGVKTSIDVRDRTGEVRWIKPEELQELTIWRSAIYDEDDMFLHESARSWAIKEGSEMRLALRKKPNEAQPQELDVPITDAPATADPSTPARGENDPLF